MTDLATQLMAKYGTAAGTTAAPAAQAFAPGGFQPNGATAPAVPKHEAWLVDWSVVPPNIRPDVHAGAYDWVRQNDANKTPKDFYAHAMTQQPGGVFGPDWVLDTAVSGNPFELTAAAAPAPTPAPAAQTVAVNPPALGSAVPAQQAATPAPASEPPFTDAEIRSLRALLQIVRSLATQAAQG